MGLVFNSFFCGAGLFDSGFREAGIKINQAYELDKNACKTYKENFGNHIVNCDLTKRLASDNDDCDGMIITYPCKKYSLGASIHNQRTGDDLFLHALRFISLKSPELYTVENVPGHKYFPVVMEYMTKLPNYNVKIYCPVNALTWLPQKRPRLIIFATKRYFNLRPPKETKRKKLKDILELYPKITYPDSIYKRMSGGYRDLPIISDPNKDDVAPLCVSHYSKDKSTRLVVDNRYPMNVRPYSVREYARLQGLDDSFVFPVSDTEAYKQIGNGVPKHFGIWLGEEVKRYEKIYTDKKLI